jgi:hypothetical protein
MTKRHKKRNCGCANDRIAETRKVLKLNGALPILDLADLVIEFMDTSFIPDADSFNGRKPENPKTKGMDPRDRVDHSVPVC